MMKRRRIPKIVRRRIRDTLRGLGIGVVLGLILLIGLPWVLLPWILIGIFLKM